MMRSTRWVFVLLVAIPTALLAQNKKPANNSLQRQKQDVQQAKTKLNTEQKEVSQAREQLERLKATATMAARQVAAVRRTVGDGYRNSPDFVQARTAAERASPLGGVSGRRWAQVHR